MGGVAKFACDSYGTATSVNVTFPRPFSSVPAVVITPTWARYSGDEGTNWWITNRSKNGFVLYVHTPGGGSCHGTLFGFNWIATANSDTSTVLNTSGLSCVASQPTPGSYKKITVAGTALGGFSPYVYKFYAPNETGSNDWSLYPIDLTTKVPGVTSYGSQNYQGQFSGSYMRVYSVDGQTADVACTY
jgi:hypothetical protein